MKLEEYNKLFPIGTVILPKIFCTNSFTINMLEKQKKMAIENELNTLNNNKFNAIWKYIEGLGIVRIK